MSNYLINSNIPLKAKNSKQKLNYSEDSKIVDANKFPMTAYKKSEKLIKMNKK